jgi:hypothetical protein
LTSRTRHTSTSALPTIACAAGSDSVSAEKTAPSDAPSSLLVQYRVEPREKVLRTRSRVCGVWLRRGFLDWRCCGMGAPDLVGGLGRGSLDRLRRRESNDGSGGRRGLWKREPVLCRRCWWGIGNWPRRVNLAWKTLGRYLVEDPGAQFVQKMRIPFGRATEGVVDSSHRLYLRRRKENGPRRGRRVDEPARRAPGAVSLS